MKGSADKFWDRMAPLFRDVAGQKGLVINIGWLMDFVLEWNGDLNQKIPLPKNMKLAPFFRDEGMVAGTTEQRQELWRKRFDQASQYETVNYEPWTYGDLKALAAVLRQSAAAHGLKNMRVGTFVLGWNSIYQGNKSSFFANHPSDQLPSGQTGFNPTQRLKADPTRYGAYPQGIPEGLPITEFFGKQWGDMSKKVGLDILVLRDSALGMGIYQRKGPYGFRPPEDPAVLKQWCDAEADLVRQTKKANPAVFLMGYSNAASAVADWRVNCFDLEAIAKEGYLDAYIDQSWAGAWNEVAQRDGQRFWNSVALGWSYQLAYTLLHGAVLSETPCKHYILTETFDAWESWDIIGTAPGRLRWGIWAYTHAAVKRPDGLKFPDGSYISWANQGKRLLSGEQVEWLATQTNAAQRDLENIKDVSGPTLVYSRSAMEWQNANAPATFMKEWIDEQAGTLMKWGVPILSAARVENLDKIKSDLFIIQTPVHLKDAELASVKRLVDSGKPVLLVGSPWNGIDKSLLKPLGLSAVVPKAGEEGRVEYRGSLDGRTSSLFEGLNNTFVVPQFFTANKLDTTGGARSYYSVGGSPALVRKGNVMVWDAPELQRNFAKEGGDKYPLDEMIGSHVPYVVLSRMLTGDLREGKAFCAAPDDILMPAWCGAWTLNDGSLEVLTGEIEEGLDHTGKAAAPLTIWLPGPMQGRCLVQEVWNLGRYVISGGAMNYVLRKGESSLLKIETL